MVCCCLLFVVVLIFVVVFVVVVDVAVAVDDAVVVAESVDAAADVVVGVVDVVDGCVCWLCWFEPVLVVGFACFCVWPFVVVCCL